LKIFKSDFIQSEAGLVFQNENVVIFFGQKKSTHESLSNCFSKIHFQKIKQTHSDLIVQASDKVYEADAHYSNEPLKGLLISTADCLPVMIYCPQTRRVAAVHAGWRGVANQIVYKTLSQLVLTGSSKKNFEVWIGPHISKNSFEVDSEVFIQIEKSAFKLCKDDFYFEKNNKFYVDLNQVVQSQIRKCSSEAAIHVTNIDTLTNLDFWSFRRDKTTAGRNLSFISLV
jgi:YfiH family protein